MPTAARKHIIASVTLAAALLLLTACAGRPSVTVRITGPGADGTLVPLRGAHVRAIALNASPMPLPVSLENLRLLTAGAGSGAYTDSRGLARLEVGADLPHLVEACGPALSDLGADPVWRGLLSEDRRTLVPQAEPGASGQSRLIVEVVP